MYEQRNHATMFLLTTTWVRLSTQAAEFSVTGSLLLVFLSVDSYGRINEMMNVAIKNERRVLLVMKREWRF